MYAGAQLFGGTMALHNFEFSREMRGYSRQEVDRTVRDYAAKLEHSEQTIAELSEQVASLQGELEIAQHHLKRLQESTPNFAGLGSKFEEVLRVAEQQAAMMLDKAKSEAEAIVAETSASTQRRLHAAKEEASQILGDAKARAEELSLASESQAADLSNKANDKLVKASEVLATAQRDAAKLRSDADNEILQMRLSAQDVIEKQRYEMQRMREETEHHVLKVEKELAERQEAAQIEHEQLHQTAVLTAKQVTEEAQIKADEVNKRALAVSQESEVLHERVRAFVQEQERAAREQAAALIDRAHDYASKRTHEVNEFVDSILARSLTRLEHIRNEAAFVEDFMAKQRATRTTDTVIAELEEQLRGQLS